MIYPARQQPMLIHATAAQAGGVFLAVLLVAAWHWPNDGLWFQGDAPRHAANGLFFWDYLRSLPAGPVSFALSYYARYPVITPLVYPPLFYVIEGVAFGLIGPSPYVAKALVLACSGAMGAYTMAWARRWGGPAAGWAGACVVLLPGFVQYSNAVMLNVPATACIIGALYHLVVWLESGARRHRTGFVLLTVASLLTYYAAAVVLPLAFVWVVLFGGRPRARAIWVIPAIILLLAITIAVVLPQHWSRNAPSLWRVADPALWVFYGHELAAIAGLPWAMLGGLGLAVTLVKPDHRRHGLMLALAFLLVGSCLVVLPAESGRYALPLVPLLAIAAVVGVVSTLQLIGPGLRPFAVVVATMLLVGSAARLGAAESVPVVSGFAEAAGYLRTRAPRDTVLYSGYHDGVFTFYVRAGDPQFQQRVVLAQKVLSRFEQNQLFVWEETSYVNVVSDVVPLLQRTCGCQWVVIEQVSLGYPTKADALLRDALRGPEFEHVQSFPIAGLVATTLELYRFLQPGDPAPPVDLMFPSFSGRIFRGVEPVASRR
jgi:hypothetical protein